jgi:hypothetical protein
MKVSKFGEKFDYVLEDLDLSKDKRSVQTIKRVNVDFPAWMMELLDREASCIGVALQSIIKAWLTETIHHHAIKHN